VSGAADARTADRSARARRAIGQAGRVTTNAGEPPIKARAVYELHLIHPDTAERHTQQLKNLLADFLLGGLIMGANTSPGNLYVKITLEIVDLRTQRTVLQMDQNVEVVEGVVDLINKDLDRLDPGTFANEWGIDPSRP
jgi:hypothetical protein